MRFYTKQHQFYCGIDRHARTMYLCILNQDGEMLVHRNMPAGPEPFLKAVAPSRTALVVCVECTFTWYWLADLCAREEIPFVLGHALYRKAIHGGKAKNDTIDAQKIAVLLRGGMLPQAYGYPAALRATRDLLRRRIRCTVGRGTLDRVAVHVHGTPAVLPDHVPERVVEDREQPGLEVGPALELVSGAERLQVGVLDEILGIRRAPGQTERRAVQAVNMRQRLLRELGVVTVTRRTADGH